MVASAMRPKYVSQMKKLNLITPATSDIAYTRLLFPDKQPHIKINMQSVAHIDRGEKIKLITRIASADDLLLALFCKNVLDYLEFEKVELVVSYLLAARMDRVMLSGEPFSLKTIAGMINQAGFSKVLIFDPHSEVSTALIDRSYAIPNHQFVRDALTLYQQTYSKTDYWLVSPDAGALKKIHQLAHFLGSTQVIECMKERDLKTGALSHFNTTANNLGGKTCFIIDDICDGGGTFAGTAGMLKEKGAVEVNLVVSHGIFSKGVQIENVASIYSTNSYREVEGIHCLPVEKYLLP